MDVDTGDLEIFDNFLIVTQQEKLDELLNNESIINFVRAYVDNEPIDNEVKDIAKYGEL